MDHQFISKLSQQFTDYDIFSTSLSPFAIFDLRQQLLDILLVNDSTTVYNRLQEVSASLSLIEPFASQWGEQERQSFMENLPRIRQQVIQDLLRVSQLDPAAKNHEEIIHAYPGFTAIVHYRIAHLFYQKGFDVVARMISMYAHRLTSIDIHPGAQIEEGCFIDHGIGVVIGETAVVGKNVTLFHGVTLGVRSFTYDEKGNVIRNSKRHPTVEEGVSIYANATILGGDTVIGKHSIIGSGVRLLKSVPPYSRIIPVSNVRSTPEHTE